MATKQATKRKNIDIKEATFKELSYMAIDADKDLKNFIEETLDQIAEKNKKAREKK